MTMAFKRFNHSAPIPDGVATESNVINIEASWNERLVFQADVPAGCEVVLQARINQEFDWIDVLAATGSSVLTAIEGAPQFRVVVTKGAADVVRCGVLA
jgi:hypothetical protein